MEIVDTHTHIYDENFDSDIDQVVDRALKNGVKHMLLPNIDTLSINRLHAIADRYPNECFPMMGLHPTSVTTNWTDDLIIIKKMFKTRNYVAVGEIGIDLYWDKLLITEQQAAFEEQLRWSIELDLPVSIHSREANMEVLECIRAVGADKLRGVFHSFSGNSQDLETILSFDNFLIGINGVVTFKNSDLPETLRATDLTRLVIETDAPYLTPAPYRGKRNEPSYTQFIVRKLSELYGVSVSEVAAKTTSNAKRMFGL